MKIKTRIVCLLLAYSLLPVSPALAAPASISAIPIEPAPPNVQGNLNRPMIMLNMSRDHQLSHRAYNEYTDYDGDGVPDGGYLQRVRYVGYFDPYKCYSYDKTLGYFVPMSISADKYCSGQWSGNFLNWSTMTSMDLVRKVLFGGLRRTDTSTLTVLERAHLPTDAHAFAKYYNGSDLGKLAPVPSNTSELTLCNLTYDTKISSERTTKPPLVRAVAGNYMLWAANERFQCMWKEEISKWGETPSGNPVARGGRGLNGNDPAITGLNAAYASPVRAQGLAMDGVSTGEFIVRVEVCDSAMAGTERCKRYPSGNLKPVGLLQEYGETNLAEFGLMTGSFDKNISGGVLRRNVTSFRNEVNATTDGTFTSTAGIVSNLSRLRILGYDYATGTEGGTYSDCNFQMTSFGNNECRSWGNPLGEMYVETIRYLAGLQPTELFMHDFYDQDPSGAWEGLTTEFWGDPMKRGAAVDGQFGKPQCRPLSVLNVNASVPSHDGDDGEAAFATLHGSPSLAAMIDIVGDGTSAADRINGTQRFVGRNGTDNNGACTAKLVNKLSKVDGLCPTAPNYRGSFSIAGAAYWAHVNPIRTDLPLMTDPKAPNFHVDTYSIQLNPGVPRIEIKSQLDPSKKVVVQPTYRLVLSDGTVGTARRSGSMSSDRCGDMSIDNYGRKHVTGFDTSRFASEDVAIRKCWN